MIFDPMTPTQPETDVDVDVKSETKWARDWLNEVGEARKALERAEAVAELRESRAYALPNPLAHAGEGNVRGGIHDRMRAADDMIDGEMSDDALDWARVALALFDHMAKVNRVTLRGAMLDGLDIAEMRHALGASDNQICDAFHISRSKLFNDLNAFIDYLDYIGPESAFSLADAGENNNLEAEEGANSTGTAAMGPHADTYNRIIELTRKP